MGREQFDAVAGPGRMSEAARAEVEALRSSDRLQRIFQSDPARPRLGGGGQGGAGRRLADLAAGPRAAAGGRARAADAARGAGARRGGVLSPRARVLVGLVPVYLAAAVLAVEGVKALRDAPERAAYAAAAVPEAAQTRPAPPAEAIEPPGPAGPERLAGLPAAPERAAVPVSRPGPGRIAGDTAATARDGLAGTTGGGEAVLAGIGAGEGAGHGLGERLGAADPDPGQAAPDTPVPAEARTDSPAMRAGAAERAPSAPEGAGAGAPAEDAGAIGPQPGALAALDPDWEAETVPQATWSPQGPAAAPVPPPRFARLSEVLARNGGDRAGSPARRAHGAVQAPPPRASAPASRRRAEEEPGGGQAGPPAGARQPGTAQPRIVVHYRRDSDPSAARRVAAELQARGYARTELRPVSFSVAQANVRFFHAQNRPVARAVNELVQATGRPSALRDFTHYAPLPSVGTVEVWLPG